MGNQKAKQKRQEREKINEIMSAIISQQTRTVKNDTILFYTQLDDSPQFLRIPPNNQLQKSNNRPRMSFFVSTPFQGQATVVNNTYVIKDTIIMRIDCEVYHTEYIGYGSQRPNETDKVDNPKSKKLANKKRKPKVKL